MLTEDGEPLLTEEGEPLALEEGEPLTTETGEIITTETGEPITVAAEPSVISEGVGLAASHGTVSAVGQAVLDSGQWTGLSSRSRRLVGLRDELEVARLAVSELIDGLADEDGNGGPLDGHDDALDALRELHRTLGGLLDAIDRGTLTDELGDSLAAEVARFGQRALDDLRDDPARYLLAATAFAVLTASGLGVGAGLVAGAALRLTRKKAG